MMGTYIKANINTIFTLLFNEYSKLSWLSYGDSFKLYSKFHEVSLGKGFNLSSQ